MIERVVSQHLQDCILFLCIIDTDFIRVAKSNIPTNYFSQVTGDLIRLVYNYYDMFKRAPSDGKDMKDDFYTEFLRFVEQFDEDRKKLYFDYLERIGRMGEEAPPSKEYVLSRINKFLRARILEGALMESAPLVEQGDFERVEQILMKALKSGVPLEEKFLTIPDDGPAFLREKNIVSEIVAHLGVPLLDRRIGGLRRGQLICFFGPAKGAKSWACLNVAYQAMSLGYRVLYLSHELTAQEIGQRVYQKVGGLSTEPEEEVKEVTVKYLEDEVEKEQTFLPKSIQDVNEQEEVARLLSRFTGKLKVRKYPMGTCSVGEVERLLDYLETFESFIPDVVVTDYVEIMALPRREEKHEAINETYIGLKSIADQRNLLMVTASQITRAGYGKSRVAQAYLPAGDIRKLANIDLGISLCASEAQAAQNLMNVFVEVNRSGPQGFGCTIYNVFEIGQFAQYCRSIQSQSTTSRLEEE